MSFDNEEEELSIESPEQLVAVFGKLLQRRYPGAAPCHSVDIQPLSEAAILSRVYQVTVSQANEHVPSRWIAKFLKSSLPLEDHFYVESNFYTTCAQELREAVTFIEIPKALYCGAKCIVLEYIANTTSYTLLEGCPHYRLELVLSSLAHIHAHFWNAQSPISDLLSPTAGIGSAMSGLQKEQTFPKLWKAFVDEVLLDDAQRVQLHTICRDLSKRRLGDTHDQVHQYQPTMIHGDFHVGNLLFHDNNNTVTILDWATCGTGNFMVDVVFFFLVSTQLSTKEMMHTWLPYYHQVLLESNPNIDVSWKTSVYYFRTCLLNQFIVLVCHDEISKMLLKTQVESSQLLEHYSQHFTNVNKRCVEALLSEEMNLSEYALPPLKTASDMATINDESETSDGVGVIRHL